MFSKQLYSTTFSFAVFICFSTAQCFETISPDFRTNSYSRVGQFYRRQVTNSEPFRDYVRPTPSTEEPPSKIQQILTQVQRTIHHQGNCRLNKVKLSQLESSPQYIEYGVNFPPLKQFHFCLWLKSFNLSTEHTLFSYAVPRNPDMITMWISPIQNQTGFHLVLNGIKVYNLNYVIPTGKWFHICQSWNGLNGHFEVFVNGVSVGDGYGPPKLIGFEVPGGGRPVTGQEQDLAWNENEVQEKGTQGVQGEITLFEMDDVALGVGVKGSTTLRPLQTDCLPRQAGNLISWGKSHLKLFGGAEIYGVDPICASFPE